MSKYLVVLMLLLCTITSAFATTVMIDGKVHPELIPATTAWRLWFSAVSLPSGAAQAKRDAQTAYLRAAGLEGNDAAAVRGDLETFYVQFNSVVNTQNSAVQAKAANLQVASDSPFFNDRTALVNATIANIKAHITAAKFNDLRDYVMQQKQTMRIPDTSQPISSMTPLYSFFDIIAGDPVTDRVYSSILIQGHATFPAACTQCFQATHTLTGENRFYKDFVPSSGSTPAHWSALYGVPFSAGSVPLPNMQVSAVNTQTYQLPAGTLMSGGLKGLWKISGLTSCIFGGVMQEDDPDEFLDWGVGYFKAKVFADLGPDVDITFGNGERCAIQPWCSNTANPPVPPIDFLDPTLHDYTKLTPACAPYYVCKVGWISVSNSRPLVVWRSCLRDFTTLKTQCSDSHSVPPYPQP